MKCASCGKETGERFPIGKDLKSSIWVCKRCLYIDWYLRLGFSLIPLKPRSKEPAVSSWKTYQERRPTDGEIGGWKRLNGNLAVVTGSVSGNLVVMDFDDYGVYEKVFPKHGELERATFVVKTSRGVHVYIRSAKEPGQTEKYKDTKFEYRANGSYVVAPPSTHPDGCEYRRIGVFEVIEVADAKEEKALILKKLGVNPLRAVEAKANTGRPPLGYVPPCIQRLKGVSEGFRNEAAMRMACFMLRELGMEEGEVWKRLAWWNHLNRPPLSETELRRTFTSALKGGYRYGCRSMADYCVSGLCRIGRIRESENQI